MEAKVTFPNAGTEGSTPKGKRTIRRTNAGNLIGYIGGRLWVNFGDVFAPDTRERANAWVEGREE